MKVKQKLGSSIMLMLKDSLKFLKFAVVILYNEQSTSIKIYGTILARSQLLVIVQICLDLSWKVDEKCYQG